MHPAMDPPPLALTGVGGQGGRPHRGSGGSLLEVNAHLINIYFSLAWIRHMVDIQLLVTIYNKNGSIGKGNLSDHL